MYDSNISNALTFLGVVQIFAVFISLLWLYIPICLSTSRIDQEPRVRMVRWLGSRVNKWVMLTKALQSWYPKSISEYSGARGSTQHQVLAAATSVAGTLQVAIAILLWIGSYATVGRMIVLIIGGVCCVFIGQMESAINWERVIKRYQSDRPPDITYFIPREALTTEETAILDQAEREGPGVREPVQQKEYLRVRPVPTAKVLIERKEASIESTTINSADRNLALPEKPDDRGPGSPELVAIREQSPNSQPNDRPKDYPTVLRGSGSSESEVRYDIHNIWKDHRAILAPVNPEDCVLEMLVPDEISDAEYQHTKRHQYTLEQEARDKSLLSFVHMIAALGFIGCTFTSEAVMNKISPGDFDGSTSIGDSNLSFVLAVIGMTAFVMFSMMSWLSGNYDEGMRASRILRLFQARRVAPWCVMYQRYPGHSGVQFRQIQENRAVISHWCCVCSNRTHVEQYVRELQDARLYQPTTYDHPDDRCGCQPMCIRSRAAWIGLVFIVVETTAFGVLILSVAVEAIWA
jgi:hypothetical protein